MTALGTEAGIAAEHARLAVEAASDLEALQKHVRHVRHAVDPSTEPSGPGKGYGVLKAAQGVERHIQLATRSEGASEDIQRHATHVAACARTVASWSGLILAASERALSATSAEDATGFARRIEELTRHILEGTDADGDGQVSWRPGEGGIAQAERHMALLVEGERFAKR